MDDRIDEELDIRGLRASFLEFTRAAFRSISRHEKPLILDIGCGAGAATIELADLSDGRIMAIDPNEEALERLRLRIKEHGLSDRVRIRRCSIFDNGFAAATFDIVWEEGVFHLLDSGMALAEAARLVKGGGFLSMFETNLWIDETLGLFEKYGFEFHRRLRLPDGAWWTKYYGPLEKRVARMRTRSREPEELEVMERLEREILEVRADIPKTDCSFLIMQRLQH